MRYQSLACSGLVRSGVNMLSNLRCISFLSLISILSFSVFILSVILAFYKDVNPVLSLTFNRGVGL